MKTYESISYKSSQYRNNTPSTTRTNSRISYSNKRGYSVEQRDQRKISEADPNENIAGLITQAKSRPITSVGSPTSNMRLNNHNSPRQMSDVRVGYSLSPSKVSNPYNVKFLPPKSQKHQKMKTLVLDLDETLVHSAFKPFDVKSDIILKIDFENKIHDIHVLVRPGVEEFLERMSKHYELVIFTASLSKYADPLMDRLDSKRLCSYRLFREHCTLINNAFVKDLKKLDRPLKDIIILDNSPISYALNVENGFPSKTWKSDPMDNDLALTANVLEFLAYSDDVRIFIKKMFDKNTFCYTRALQVINEFNETERITNIKPSTPKTNYEAAEKKSNVPSYNSYNQYNSEKQQNYLGNNYNTYHKPNLAINPICSLTPDIPNKPINIRIINNNYNQYIINSDQANLEKKQKSINTFRKSHLPEEKKPKDNSFSININNNKYNSKNNISQITSATNEIKNVLNRNNSKSGLISTKNTDMINSKVYSTKYTSLMDNNVRPSSAALKSRHIREASTGSSGSYNIQRIPSANSLIRNNSVRDKYMTNPLSGNNTTRPFTRSGKTTSINYNIKPSLNDYNSNDDHGDRRGFSLTSRNSHKKSYDPKNDNKGYLSKKSLILANKYTAAGLIRNNSQYKK